MEVEYERKTDINSKLAYAVMKMLGSVIELDEEEDVLQEDDLQGRDLVSVLRLLRERQLQSYGSKDESNDDEGRDEKYVSPFGRVIDMRLVLQPRRRMLVSEMMVR